MSANETITVQSEKFNGLKNEAFCKKKKKVPPYPKHLFPLHTMIYFVGPCGVGKTNAASLLAHEYMEAESFNRIFILSPTYEYNDALKKLKPDPDDVYSNKDDPVAAINAIDLKVKKMSQQYEFLVKYKEIYNKWKNKEKLKLAEMSLLNDYNFAPPPKKIPFPSPLLIIDDMSHTKLYVSSTKNSFPNLVLRHRHVYGIGLSIFMLVQTFKTGAQLALRQVGNQFMLFPSKDSNQLRSMYEEVAGQVSFEDFEAIFKKATQGSKHNFLTVDARNENKKRMFRKGFDEYLYTKASAEEDEESLENSNKRRKLTLNNPQCTKDMPCYKGN